MWKVQCKSDKNSQTWSTLATYDNKTTAAAHAARVSDDCDMVIVVDPAGDVVWNSNEPSLFIHDRLSNDQV